MTILVLAMVLLVLWGLQSRRAAAAALDRMRADLEVAKAWSAARAGDLNRAEAALVRAEERNMQLTQRAAQLDETLARIVARPVSVSESLGDKDPFMHQFSARWFVSDLEAVQAASRTALLRALAVRIAEQMLVSAGVGEKK